MGSVVYINDLSSFQVMHYCVNNLSLYSKKSSKIFFSAYSNAALPLLVPDHISLLSNSLVLNNLISIVNKISVKLISSLYSTRYSNL